MKTTAVYARYSTDEQRCESIDAQIFKCEQYADPNGLKIDKSHIYTDEAISGSSAKRPGMDELMAAAQEGLFEAIIVDDISRLSRDVLDSLSAYRLTRDLGIELHSASEGLFGDDQNSKMLFYLKAMVNESYIDSIRTQTRRSQENQVRNGYIAGSLPYGFESKKVGATGVDSRGRIRAKGSVPVVIPEQALVVQQLFRDYANGASLKAIVKKLNQENVQSKYGGVWSESTISRMLNNKKYIGVYSWGKRQNRRRNGKQVKRKVEPSKVVTVEIPEMRIIEDELWQKVQDRINAAAKAQPKRSLKHKAEKQSGYSESNPKYLLSGALKCGVCGGSMSRTCGKPPGYWGCRNRENGTCQNTKRIRQDILEDKFLGHILNTVLTTAGIERISKRIVQQIREKHSEVPQDITLLEKQLAKKEKEINRYLVFIAQNDDSRSVSQALSEAEELKAKIEDELELARGVVQQIPDVPTAEWIRSKVKNLKQVLEVKTAKSAFLIRDLFGEIELTPQEDEKGEIKYTAKTKLKTFALYKDADKGSISLRKWRWGESNPRP